MTSESLILGTKGVICIASAGALSIAGRIAQTISEPTELVKNMEALGPQGLLLLGIVFLYRANQRLETEIKNLHEEAQKYSKEQMGVLKEQMKASDSSRERLYEAIRGSIDK